MALKRNIAIAIFIGITGETPRFTSFFANIEILVGLSRAGYRIAADDCSIESSLSIGNDELEESPRVMLAPVQVVGKSNPLVFTRTGQDALQNYPGFERDTK